MSIAATSTPSNPRVGEVHSLRISITELFRSKSNFDSLTNHQSKSSSSSSSSKSQNRPTKRPCVVWRTKPDLQVLVMSKFDGVDVSDLNIRLFDHLPQEYVLKRLVAVYPTTPYGGKRSIVAATKSSIKPIVTVNTNLILMPVSIEAPRCWKVAVEYFPVHELEYIAELIFQLAEDERAEQLKMIKELKHQPLVNEQEAIEDDSTSSSSSFSLAKRRSDSRCTEWEKNDFINCWLNDGFSKISDEDKSSETDLK